MTNVWTIRVVQSTFFFFRTWYLVYKLLWRSSMNIDCFTRMMECSFMFSHNHRINKLKKVAVGIFRP